MVSQSNEDDHVRVDLDAELSAAGRARPAEWLRAAPPTER
jgi:hypothetical protein